MIEPIFKAKKKDCGCRCISYAIMVITTVILSCTKNEIQQNHYQYDAYRLIRDWYTLDTGFVNRAILWEDDSIWRNETKLALDTATDMWWLMCASEHFAAHLEHWYYLKNGKKIQPSAYPKT